MDDTLEKLRRLYAEYLADIERDRAKRDGLRGALNSLVLGSRGDDGFSERFAIEVEQALMELDPDREPVRPVIEYVLSTGAEYRDDMSVGLMFSAVQRFLPPLVAHETPEYRAELASWYDDHFPRRCITPVMRDFRRSLRP